jgi:hypothetical protein
LTKHLSKIKTVEETKADDSKLLPAERVKKTALNTLVRFDIDAKGFDTSANAMYDEIRRKGLG